MLIAWVLCIIILHNNSKRNKPRVPFVNFVISDYSTDFNNNKKKKIICFTICQDNNR